MFEQMGDYLLAIAAEMPFETDWSSSLNGSWYLSPRRHTVEFLCFNLFFLCTVRFFYKRALHPGSPIAKLFESYAPPTKRSKVEITVLVTLTASLLITVAQKWYRGGLLYLLQPCHMSAMLLITILAGPKNKKWPHILLNIYFHIMWGTSDDNSGQATDEHSAGHIESHAWGGPKTLQHYLLLLTPVYMIWSNRYVIWPVSMDVALMSFSFFALYHSAILSTTALFMGQNLNYLLMPPPGPLQMFGKWYRPVMYVFCILLTMTRYLLVEVVIQYLPRRSLSSAQLRLNAKQKAL
ncbi:hypothetical protein BGW38_006878 [Lunasporangiospora selenospora]|uniref:Uncharacterized protein n=1 Tax=Lunasporangiospora selenospora TaxID=979761 RepID=A0A9P6KH09_9FUNG|nr:hypothetical protein BGW38_006878 [Lunasporangiospora selenospora]